MDKDNISHPNIPGESPLFSGPHHTIWKSILIIIYTVVFIGGSCGVIKMSIFLLKMNTLSVTTTAIVNLVVNHGLFLVTVPFRLYYYIEENWIFGKPFCKIVSGMIYFHMYLTFLFYVIILIIRSLIFFQWKDKVEFYRNLHAVGMSIAVWILASITEVVVISCWYGAQGNYENNTCFTFHQELTNDAVKAINYTIIAIIIIATCILLGLQVFMISKVMKKLSGSVWSHQEFWAQLKSLFFILVIIFCFLPHHFFRLYYIQNVDKVSQEYNEFSLSITAISCLDLFSFAVTGSKTFRQKMNSLLCC